MEKLKELGRRYRVLRLAQFGMAGIVGFLVLEAILVTGLYILYGSPNLPSDFASSPGLVALDVFASIAGVVVGFFVNELTTVRSVVRGKGWKDTMVRLGKFEGVYAIGSAITIGVQLALLAWLALSPPVGNIVGATLAYPVSYAISMRFVWRT
jgi:putative flippase GtrA